MKSPFPGMDPYVEHLAGDLHLSLLVYSSDALQPLLGSDLRARLQERAYVADGNVLITDRYIAILDFRAGDRLVTVIQFVRPENRTWGNGNLAFVKTRWAAIDAGANVVEVDLFRAGTSPTLAGGCPIPPMARSMYHACVYRAVQAEVIEYYPIHLRQRLPRLPIPLRPTDRDVVLDLQAVLDTAYERGRYDDIDYSQPLKAPLDGPDEQWARDLLAAASTQQAR